MWHYWYTGKERPLLEFSLSPHKSRKIATTVSMCWPTVESVKPLCPVKVLGRICKVLRSITTISISWAIGGGSPLLGWAPKGHLGRRTFLDLIFDRENLTGAHLQKDSDPSDPERFQQHVHWAQLCDQELSLLQSPGLCCFFGIVWIQFDAELRWLYCRGIPGWKWPHVCDRAPAGGKKN